MNQFEQKKPCKDKRIANQNSFALAGRKNVSQFTQGVASLALG